MIQSYVLEINIQKKKNKQTTNPQKSIWSAAASGLFEML